MGQGQAQPPLQDQEAASWGQERAGQRAEGRTRASEEQAWGRGFRPAQSGCGRRREQTRGATSWSGHDRPLRVLLSRPRPHCQERASTLLGVQSGWWGARHRAPPSVPSLRRDHGEHRGGRTCLHGGGGAAKGPLGLEVSGPCCSVGPKPTSDTDQHGPSTPLGIGHWASGTELWALNARQPGGGRGGGRGRGESGGGGEGPEEGVVVRGLLCRRNTQDLSSSSPLTPHISRKKSSPRGGRLFHLGSVDELFWRKLLR